MPSVLNALHAYRERPVVVAVSGGADSVALLRALHLIGARPVVAHLDHALRPGSAEDARWVQALAAGLGLPFETARVEVAQVAGQRGWNVEDAARRVRYEFLNRVARQYGADAVVTAHTRRDQAETVLMQLLRGEAVLGGMPAQRGRIRRPWLHISRIQLEEFLASLGQDWREDASNADSQYTRAWLRQQVMPLLTARYPGLEAALARLAAQQAQDDEALTALAAHVTSHAPLEYQSPAVLRRYVRQQLARAGLDYHAEQLDQLARALRTGKTAHLTLPGGHQVTVTGGRLHTQLHEWPEPDFPIPDGWELRRWQPGDRIRLPGGTRKLSDVFTDLKTPRQDRGRVPLLAAGTAVQWLGLDPSIWAVGAREQAQVPPDPVDTAMAEALNLARQAAEQNEVPVGAVVLDAQGNIVGRGRNTSREDGDMTRHAELAAIREAAQCLNTPYLTHCTLVVTLEPCPMCLGAALEARLGHIVYGAANPKAGALGGVSDLLAHHWGHLPRVTGGVRAREAAKLLKQSFRRLREAGR